MRRHNFSGKTHTSSILKIFFDWKWEGMNQHFQYQYSYMCAVHCRAICNRQEAVNGLAENQRIRKLDRVMGRTGNGRWGVWGNGRWGVWDQVSKPLHLALLCIVMGDKICQPKLPTKIPPRHRMSFGALLSLSSHRLGEDFHHRVTEACQQVGLCKTMVWDFLKIWERPCGFVRLGALRALVFQMILIKCKLWGFDFDRCRHPCTLMHMPIHAKLASPCVFISFHWWWLWIHKDSSAQVLSSNAQTFRCQIHSFFGTLGSRLLGL